MSLFVVKCRFRATEDSQVVEGLAICSNPDTPVTFIHPDGTPLVTDEIWDYNLVHYSPWGKFD